MSEVNSHQRHQVRARIALGFKDFQLRFGERPQHASTGSLAKLHIEWVGPRLSSHVGSFELTYSLRAALCPRLSPLHPKVSTMLGFIILAFLQALLPVLAHEDSLCEPRSSVTPRLFIKCAKLTKLFKVTSSLTYCSVPDILMIQV